MIDWFCVADVEYLNNSSYIILMNISVDLNIVSQEAENRAVFLGDEYL